MDNVKKKEGNTHNTAVKKFQKIKMRILVQMILTGPQSRALGSAKIKTKVVYRKGHA